MNHRVAFFGASGTGKTRIMNTIAAKYEIPIVPIGARSVAIEMGFASPYDADAAGKRLELQERVFHTKLQWELDHRSFVTDRTVFDNLVYATMHGCADRITLQEIDRYRDGMLRYTTVFFLPVAAFHHIGSDPMRIPNMGYHILFETLGRALLVRYQIPHIVLDCDVDKRAGWVDKALRDAALEAYDKL